LATTQQYVVSAPFDAVANRYDETFTSSLIGRAQRAAVWKELAKTFHSGQRILEIGCGTGVDACFLAERGIQIVACDSSPEMIAVTTRRIREKKLEKLVQPLLLRAEDIASLSSHERFDGAFSSFGVLNCIDDHASLGKHLARLLKPEAQVLLCWMGPCCLWEIIWYLSHGNKDKAFRRVHKNGVDAHIADGASLHVHYPSAKSLSRTFASHFRLASIKGIGVAVPPSYLEPWARRHPNILRRCGQLDSAIAGWPVIRTLGDHILARFERKTPAGER
jgi:ubiquinone/menaquinone biosynthesis C-methylase UbiE